MPRIARIVVPGWPHHVTQRGNHRQTVFFCDAHREVYLQLLLKYDCLYQALLVGFCLMDNHVHLLPVPVFIESLSMAVGRADNDYSRWLNIRCERTGHLWQARFFSCPVAPVSCWDVLAYIELNPVRAGLVAKPEDWVWSSARAHLTGRDDSGLLEMDEWRKHFTPDTWREFLNKKQRDARFLRRIRTATRTGRPFASIEAVRRLESQLDRQILPRRYPAPVRKRS